MQLLRSPLSIFSVSLFHCLFFLLVSSHVRVWFPTYVRLARLKIVTMICLMAALCLYCCTIYPTSSKAPFCCRHVSLSSTVSILEKDSLPSPRLSVLCCLCVSLCCETRATMGRNDGQGTQYDKRVVTDRRRILNDSMTR